METKNVKKQRESLVRKLIVSSVHHEGLFLEPLVYKAITKSKTLDVKQKNITGPCQNAQHKFCTNRVKVLIR